MPSPRRTRSSFKSAGRVEVTRTVVTKTTQRSLPFTPVGPGSPSSASRSSRDDDDDENTEEDGDASTGLPTDASDMNTDDDGVVDVEGDGDGGVSVERVERQVRVTDVLVMKDGATGAVLGNLSREKTVEGNAEDIGEPEPVQSANFRTVVEDTPKASFRNLLSALLCSLFAVLAVLAVWYLIQWLVEWWASSPGALSTAYGAIVWGLGQAAAGLSALAAAAQLCLSTFIASAYAYFNLPPVVPAPTVTPTIPQTPTVTLPSHLTPDALYNLIVGVNNSVSTLTSKTGTDYNQLAKEVASLRLNLTTLEIQSQTLTQQLEALSGNFSVSQTEAIALRGRASTLNESITELNGKLVNLSAVLVAVDKNATAAGDVAAQAFGNAAEANTTASSALSTANAALNQTTIALQTITNVSITLSKQFNDKLALHIADSIGLEDYALASGGACVAADLTTGTAGLPKYARDCNHEGGVCVIARGQNETEDGRQSPRAALNAVVVPGNCWPLDGASGRLGVWLRQPVKVTAVSIDHPDWRTSTYKSAPKSCSVWGYRSVKDPKPFELVRFKFNPENTVQTFPVTNSTAEAFPFVQLRIDSNYGANATCLYRFRVHGPPTEKP